MTLFSSRILVLMACPVLLACSLTRKTAVATDDISLLLSDSALSHAHVGVCIYDSEHGNFKLEYNSEKYFVPASNTKLFSCYAALSYLGDSLPGLGYASIGDSLHVFGTGDPSFMHEDFARQPVFEFLTRQTLPIAFHDGNWRTKQYGSGWAWDDYDADYMPERSPLPFYGNMATIGYKKLPVSAGDTIISYQINSVPKSVFSLPATASIAWPAKSIFFVRAPYSNLLYPASSGKKQPTAQSLPFITDTISSFLGWFKTFNPNIGRSKTPVSAEQLRYIYSQPTDSLLTPLMHRSDNLFAEQALLMVSNKVLGYMDEDSIIARLLATDLKDLPNKPVWADGSGLSRYNLFTPKDFIWILNKMAETQPFSRLSQILATGNSGTLTNYYKDLTNRIFAKTGTLGGQVALSGFLIAESGKRLVFSVLVNNHRSSSTAVRRAVEKYLVQLAAKN